MTLLEKIKLLMKIRKPVGQLVEEIEKSRDKYKTVQFWMSIVLIVSSIVASANGLIPPKIALILTITLGSIYNALRAMKNTQIEGVTPLLRSTRFWVGFASIVSAWLIALQDGGISSDSLKTAITIMGGVMTICQAIGLKQPEPLEQTAPPTEEPPKPL